MYFIDVALEKIPVMIHDERGKEVFKMDAGGPCPDVHLRDGKYTVKASYDGHEQQKTIQIGRGLKKLMFHWPARLG